MKKILFSIFTAIMAIGFVGCEYDDSDLWNEVNSLKDRVLTLEQLCQQMNTNISSLQSLVSALQNQDYITSVTPIKQGNDVIGYTITFAKGEPITIYHGQDGKNGADGEDGKDGYTPVIGVDKDEDGVYYWTLDGEWLTDAEGNKIPTSGKDGADGEDGEGGNGSMPELKIQGGYWYVSYDGGENWERLGRATGYDGTDGKDGQNGKDGDSFFKDINIEDDYIEFILDDGTSIIIPRDTNSNPTITNNEAFKDALESDNEVINIALGEDVTIDVAAWQNNAFGGANTEIIYIDGGNNTITFNQTNSDWNNITTDGAKLIIKNAHITNSGYNNGPWNRHDLNFACDVELENVTSDKAIALKAGGKLTNVTINDANTSDTYALWIQPNGQTVTLDGCTIDMLACSDGRGIKIDEQYVDAADVKKVTLNVSKTTFKTEEKSAVIVKSAAGAEINWGAGNDISQVAADSTNAVWVDSDSSAYFDLVVVNGASKIQEP